jgi:hypothetical protein
MANMYMEECSILLILRDTQIKTIMGYCFILGRMAIIKKNKDNKCKKGSEEKEILLHCFWGIN